MTASIGVLCARVRVEEKQLIAALAEAGVPAMPLPPARLPLPIGPEPSPLVPPPSPGSADGAGVAARVVIDRCQDRAVAAAVIPIWRALGVAVLDAGLAATGNRLAVAAALAAAGLPRPASRLACSEEASLAAIAEIGCPATLLPLTPGAAAVPLRDHDAAEAVLEHRAVLGSAHDSVALIQAGLPDPDDRFLVTVVGGQAIAVAYPDERAVPACALRLAEAAAGAIGAVVAGVEIAMVADGLVVWDVLPVPEFRHGAPLDGVTVADAVARLAVEHPGVAAPHLVSVQLGFGHESAAVPGREAAGGVALSA